MSTHLSLSLDLNSIVMEKLLYSGSPDAGGWVSPLTSHIAIPVNTFTHIAVVRSDSDFFLYLNGKISSAVKGLYWANFTSSATLRVGSRHTPGTETPYNLFPGVIRNAAFYNKAFSASDIFSSFLNNGQNIGAIGGAKGSLFNDAQLVTKVIINVDNDSFNRAFSIFGVVSLQVFWGEVAGPIHLNPPMYTGVEEFTFTLAPNEFITGAFVQFDEFLQSIQFITNQRVSPVYGKDRGVRGTLTLPPGTGLAGFFGTGGWAIDSIGMNYIFVQEYSEPPTIISPPSNSTKVGDIKVHV